MAKIAIIGAGAFGFALAKHLSDKIKSEDEFHNDNIDVSSLTIFDVDKDVIAHMKKHRTQKNLFPEIILNEFVIPTDDVEMAVCDADIIVISIPTQFIRGFLESAISKIKDEVVLLNSSKGFELETNDFISDIARDVFAAAGKSFTFACLSGGMIAKEFISGFGIFGAEISCMDKNIGASLQSLFSSKKLRVYLNDDVIGVEASGALKNVISIASGFSDGLGYPYGSKTLIVTLGAHDIMQLSIGLGAKPHTFNLYTQAFGNDFIMSCTGETRNRYLGELIGKGMKPADAIEQLKVEKKTAEGYHTAKVAYEMAREMNIKTPIIDLVYSVLYESKSPRDEIQKIMAARLEPIKDSGYWE